ncbi:MAG: thiamine pyrophosphate-dependent enzyme, partial [Variovorax sp.]
VLQTLAGLRARDSIVVEEAPTARSVMHGYLPMWQSGGFYTMCSGGLGHSMPAAVGVALAEAQANSGRKVIGVIGDGSGMYAIQALWSAAQLNLPITFVILKNGRYAALQDFAPVFGFEPGETLQGTDLPGMDFVALARGQGCEAVTARDAGQLADVLRDALAATRPTLVEVEVA